VRERWRKDLYAGHLFVFVGMRRDRCKVLLWERGGLAIYYKRLERGRFRLPRLAPGASHMEMDGTALAMLLDGIDFGGVRRAKTRSLKVPVGTPLSRRPPDRTLRADFPHKAPTSGLRVSNAKLRPGMNDLWCWKWEKRLEASASLNRPPCPLAPSLKL